MATEWLNVIKITALQPIKRDSSQANIHDGTSFEDVLDVENTAALPADNAPENRYAYIFRGNELIGELSNSGAVTFFKESDAAQVELTQEGYGPEVAQKRAEEIAEALGGTIVKAATAMDQASWLKTLGAERLLGVEAANKQRNMAAQSKYNAQVIAQTQAQADAARKAKGDAAIKEFMDFMDKSTAERLRAMVLLEMGITEEDIQKMSVKKQKAAEDEIARRIKDKVERGLAQSDEQHEKNNAKMLGKMEVNVKTMTDNAIERVTQVHPADVVREVNDGAKTLGVVLDKYNLPASSLEKKRSPLFDDA